MFATAAALGDAMKKASMAGLKLPAKSYEMLLGRTTLERYDNQDYAELKKAVDLNQADEVAAERELLEDIGEYTLGL